MNAESRPEAAPENSAGERVHINVPTVARFSHVAVQPMPPLTPDRYDALREDIAEHGVLVPVVVDQHGRILDGSNRAEIATSLGIDYPVVVHEVADDDDAVDVAVTLNCARRHLTREQQREVIRNEILRRPDDSDRAIARRVGCSPSTVGAVRRPDVSKLDTEPMSRAEAEEITEKIRDVVVSFTAQVKYTVDVAGYNGVEPTTIVRALLVQRRHFERDEALAPLAPLVLDPIVDYVLAPGTAEVWRPHHAGPEFEPHTADEVESILSALRGEAVTL